MNERRIIAMAADLKKIDWSAGMLWALAIGFFIQISGKVWMVSGSGRNAQIYLWLLLPALIFSCHKLISRRGSWPDRQYLPWALFLGWVALSALWATNSETSAQSFIKRGLLIGLYLVAIHLLLNRHEDFFRRALLAGVVVVALGALVSLIYQYGVLNRPMAYRAFRIDRMGISNFANYGWPVAAGIFNGAVATWAIGVAIDKKTNKWAAAAWFMVFAVLAVYVLMTGTRGAWFALFGSCLFAVVMQKSKRGIWGIGLCILFVLGVSFFSGSRYLLRLKSDSFPVVGQFGFIISRQWLDIGYLDMDWEPRSHIFGQMGKQFLLMLTAYICNRFTIAVWSHSG
nr:hypothetical protein [Pseudomonas sp. Hg5Tf]MDH2557801.1 hypothetical protein [Pseudomonas sp. Hg5Tf]